MMEASIVATNVTSPEDGALPVLANLRFAHAETVMPLVCMLVRRCAAYI